MTTLVWFRAPDGPVEVCDCGTAACLDCQPDALTRCVTGAGWHCGDCLRDCGPCRDDMTREAAADRELSYLRGK